MKAKQTWMAIALLTVSFSQASLARECPHHSSSNQMDVNRPAALSGTSLYQLSSQWRDQDGQKVSIEQFRGKPLVFAMAYTSCKSACPILVMDLKQIEKQLPSSLKGKVRFALFSFDTQKDTPEKLQAYAKAHGLDLSVWSLLSSDEDAVRELAAASGVRYKQDANGDFSHSNVITVLDSEGEIRHQQVGLRANPKDSIEAIMSAAAKR